MNRPEVYADTVAAYNNLNLELAKFGNGFTAITTLPKPLASDTTQAEKIGTLQDLEERAKNLLCAVSDYAAKLQLLETITINPKGLEPLE